MNNLNSTTPFTSRTPSPLPQQTDFSSQFPILTAYHSAADPLTYLSTTLSANGDAFVSELTSFLNHAAQTEGNCHSLRSQQQDSALELDSTRTVVSDLQAQLRTATTERENLQGQLRARQDELISALRHTPTRTRSAEHRDPSPFSGEEPAKLPTFLSGLALKLRTNDDWYPTSQARMAYVYSRLEGKAAGQLKHGIKDDGTITFASVEDMLQILRQAYGDIDPVSTAQQNVLTARQGTQQTDLFLAEWQESALTSSLSDDTLIALLRVSLHVKILQRLSFTPRGSQPTTAASFLAWIRQVDADLRVAEPQYWRSKAPAPQSAIFQSSPAPTFGTDAMDISATATSVTWTATDVKNKRRPKNQAERDARKAYNSAHNLCQWCCEASHTSTACPTAPWNKQGKA